MVLIMTNYFVNCVYIQVCAHTYHIVMTPTVGLHDYALRPPWPHILSQVQSVPHRLGPALRHPSVFFAHVSEGFGPKFTIKLHIFGVCHHCYALFELLRPFTTCHLHSKAVMRL